MFRATVGDKAVFISADRPTEVINAAGDKLFYKEADDVDSGDTELGKGKSVQLSSGQYFVSASSSEVVVRELKTESVEDLTTVDDMTVGDKLTVEGEAELNGALNHDGETAGFLGAAPVKRQAKLTATKVASAEYKQAELTNAFTRISEIEAILVKFGLGTE